MNVLLLHDVGSRSTGTTNDHIHSFIKYSRNEIVLADYRVIDSSIADINLYDCIVIHHSIPIGYSTSAIQNLENILVSYTGLVCLFIQDEMRWVNQTTKRIKKIGVSVVFTVTQPEVTRKIYHDEWFDSVRFENVLTGYTPEHLLKVKAPNYNDRNIDVFYRARKLPAWCGYFGQEKSLIADKFKRDSVKYNLKCDISCMEADRIYGKKWIKCMTNTKAVLGAESGSSFIDFTGQIAPAIDDYVAKNPSVYFETISDKFLEGKDGDIIIKAISPRCFEAAALKTLMIMYEGEYSGVMKPYDHYVPIARDHSNMAEVVDILRNQSKAQKIIDAAYEEVAMNETWSYRNMIHRVDNVIDEEFKKIEALKPINYNNIRSKTNIVRLNRKYRLAAWKILIKYKIIVVLSNMNYFYLNTVNEYCPEIIVNKVHKPLMAITRPFRVIIKDRLLK